MNTQENKSKEFLESFFGGIPPGEIDDEESAIIDSCIEYVSSRFSRMKYILGTAIDFTLLAELLSTDDPKINEFNPSLEQTTLFERYTLVQNRGRRKANTLSLSYNGGKHFGIRKLEESVLEFFHSCSRTDYPSAYVYNTGQWKKYIDLLVNCFKLSKRGRYILCKKLLSFGLENLARNTYYIRSQKRIRLFEAIITNFKRGVAGENGGVIYQAIAYGFYSSDFPHLNILVDKVRTGSSRQKRFGDIDCYFGLDLELSIEVKDLTITDANYSSQLSGLISNINGSDVIGIAFVRDIDDGGFCALDSLGIAVLTQDDLLTIISYWDWQKQNNAVQSMLHYLSHIEQDPKAVDRLLSFIKGKDPDHDSLEFTTS